MPFGGATFRAPAQLGWGNAMKMMLTGAEFGADEALRIVRQVGGMPFVPLRTHTVPVHKVRLKRRTGRKVNFWRV